MPNYTVTEKAGRKVAGRRVKPGDTLELTETEAASDLVKGALSPAGAKASTRKRERSADAAGDAATAPSTTD